MEPGGVPGEARRVARARRGVRAANWRISGCSEQRPSGRHLQQRLVGQRRRAAAARHPRPRARPPARTRRRTPTTIASARCSRRRQQLPRLLERRAHASVLGTLLAFLSPLSSTSSERASSATISVDRQQPHPVRRQQDRKRQSVDGVHADAPIVARLRTDGSKSGRTARRRGDEQARRVAAASCSELRGRARRATRARQRQQPLAAHSRAARARWRRSCSPGTASSRRSIRRGRPVDVLALSNTSNHAAQLQHSTHERNRILLRGSARDRSVGGEPRDHLRECFADRRARSRSASVNRGAWRRIAP